MIRRVLSLGRAELILLGRNKLALFNAVLLPLAAAILLATAAGDDPDGVGAATAVGILMGFLLLFVVYYNLLSAYVARREELVLKRLRTGECTDAEVLAGTALPSVAVAVGQILVLVVAGALLLGLPVPANAPLLVLAVVAGCLVFTALALLTAPWTRSSESAQITSLPVLLGCALGAGLAFPLDALPPVVADVSRFTPLAPIVEMVRIGWLGTSADGGPLGFGGTFTEAAVPAAIALGWVVVGFAAANRWFRWDPRS